MGKNPRNLFCIPLKTSIEENSKNSKKKTVPCVFFHSANGCHRGDKCDFIHDENYRGRPTPNMDKYTRPIH